MHLCKLGETFDYRPSWARSYRLVDVKSVDIPSMATRAGLAVSILSNRQPSKAEIYWLVSWQQVSFRGLQAL